MRKSSLPPSSVKPHILSWLQRDPAAGIKPFVFTPNLASREPKPYRSVVITRACLASTTASGLLFEHASRRSSLPVSISRTVLRLVCGFAVVCVTAPAKTTVPMRSLPVSVEVSKPADCAVIAASVGSVGSGGVSGSRKN